MKNIIKKKIMLKKNKFLYSQILFLLYINIIYFLLFKYIFIYYLKIIKKI
jgi:hypothetical protein